MSIVWSVVGATAVSAAGAVWFYYVEPKLDRRKLKRLAREVSAFVSAIVGKPCTVEAEKVTGYDKTLSFLLSHKHMFGGIIEGKKRWGDYSFQLLTHDPGIVLAIVEHQKDLPLCNVNRRLHFSC